MTAILDPDAAARSPALVPDRHQEDVHPSAFAGGHELREDGGHPAVARHVPDVVLPRVVVRRVDDEFFVLGIVGRDRPDRLHVGAVPGFRHGEAAGQLHGHGVAQIPLMVSLGPEPADHAAEQTELHADLDQQRQIHQRHRLEGGKRATHVPFPAGLAGEEQARASGLADQAGLLHHPVAVRLDRQALDGTQQLRSANLGANAFPDGAPPTVQDCAQSPGLHVHLYHLLQH